MPTVSSISSGRRNWPLRLAVVAYLVLLAAHLTWAYACLGNPDELFHGPAVMVHHAATVMRGESIYGDWRQPPHIATVYGPLSYLLPGWIGRTVGAEIPDLYQIGRLISLFAALGIGLTTYGLARAMAIRRPLALAAALATLSSPVFWLISCAFRAEPAAIFWSLLAVWWFRRFERTPWCWLSGLIICVAFLFKQSAILPLPAIAAYLWLSGRRQAAMFFFLGTGLTLTAIVATLTAVTEGYYWLNAFGALQGNRAFGNLVLWPLAVLPVGLAQYALSFIWMARSLAARRLGLLECYFFVALLVPFAMTWRDGAAEYYFGESFAVAGVLMAAQWQAWRHQAPTSPVARKLTRGAVLLPAVMAVAVLLQLEPTALGRFQETVRPQRRGEESDFARFRTTVAQIDALPPPVFCEPDGLMILSKHQPFILDTWLFSGMIDQGVFDDSGVRAALAERKFRSIILRLPVTSVRKYGSTHYVPPAWLELIARGYDLDRRLRNGCYLYLPKGFQQEE
jgi:hypothetical protein